jgi:aspartate kinase
MVVGRCRALPSVPVALLVQKFGGTSVADPDRMRAVADHVARTARRGNQVVVVISAMGKETDELLRLASEVSATRPGREMDMLITAGERKAMALLCMALHDSGVDSESFTGSQAGFITDATHTNAKILEMRPERIRKALEAGRVPVVGGGAPTRLPSPSPRHSMPICASCTPTSRVCSPVIRESCPMHARWSGSRSTSCSR